MSWSTLQSFTTQDKTLLSILNYLETSLDTVNARRVFELGSQQHYRTTSLKHEVNAYAGSGDYNLKIKQWYSKQNRFNARGLRSRQFLSPSGMKLMAEMIHEVCDQLKSELVEHSETWSELSGNEKISINMLVKRLDERVCQMVV